MAQITYADTDPRFYDTRKISLDKVLQAINGGAGGGGGSSAPLACPADTAPSSTSDQTTEQIGVARADASYYAGQAQWTDGGTPRTICKLGFKTTAIDGNITAKTFKAYIFSMTGDNLNTIQATSTGISGAAIVVGWNYFTFPTPFLTSASVKYALVITPDSHDLANNIWLPARDTDNILGYPEIFTSLGVANFTPGHPASVGDVGLKIFWLT